MHAHVYNYIYISAQLDIIVFYRHRLQYVYGFSCMHIIILENKYIIIVNFEYAVWLEN